MLYDTMNISPLMFNAQQVEWSRLWRMTRDAKKERFDEGGS